MHKVVHTWWSWNFCKGEGAGVVLDEFRVENEKERARVLVVRGSKVAT
jgi:hypothetical protein